MYFVRLQWAEFSGQLIDFRNAEAHVRSIPGLAVIDAKSIYDVINSNNQVQGLTEKRTAVELMGYLEDTERVNTRTRWVHGKANPADSFTKLGSEEHIIKFMKDFKWSIVDDPKFRSAKKRDKEKMAHLHSERREHEAALVERENLRVLLVRHLKDSWPELFVQEDEIPEQDYVILDLRHRSEEE